MYRTYSLRTFMSSSTGAVSTQISKVWLTMEKIQVETGLEVLFGPSFQLFVDDQDQRICGSALLIPEEACLHLRPDQVVFPQLEVLVVRLRQLVVSRCHSFLQRLPDNVPCPKIHTGRICS